MVCDAFMLLISYSLKIPAYETKCSLNVNTEIIWLLLFLTAISHVSFLVAVHYQIPQMICFIFKEWSTLFFLSCLIHFIHPAGTVNVFNEYRLSCLSFLELYGCTCLFGCPCVCMSLVRVWMDGGRTKTRCKVH